MPFYKFSVEFGEFVAEGCCHQQSAELSGVGGFKGNTEELLLLVQHDLWNLHKGGTLGQTAGCRFAVGRWSAEGPSVYQWGKMAWDFSSRQLSLLRFSF